MLSNIQEEVVSRLSGVLTGAGGMLTVTLSFFEENAAGIGAMCTVATLCIYAYVNLTRLRREDAELRRNKQEKTDDL